MKIIFQALILIILFSCSSKNETKEYYDSGNLFRSKKYDSNGKLFLTTYYYDLAGNRYQETYKKNGFDSIVSYYKNSKVFSIGKQDYNGRKFGRWNRYNIKGQLSDVQEFLIVKNDEWLNQVWYLDKNKDTLYLPSKKFNNYAQKEFLPDSTDLRRSIFVRFKYFPKGDTLSIVNPFQAIAQDNFPLFGKLSSCYILLAKEKHNFNKDFSNLTEVKLDTFPCLKNDKRNEKNFPNYDKSHSVAFGRWFDTPGKKILRGYMVEHLSRNPTQKDSVIARDRFTYFEKIIYVKDTIKK